MTENDTRPTLSLGKNVIFSVIITLCLIAIGELGVRLWAYFFRTSYERYNFATGRLELVPNLRYITHNGDEFSINSNGFLGPEFSRTKRSGVYRIFAVGDSCTFGNGIWKKAYPALLQELLNADPSPREFEVINAGIEGYNSSFAKERVQDTILSYQPDLVMLYIGWNDLMKSDPQSMAVENRDNILVRLKQESYLIKAYRKLIFFYLRPLIFRPEVVVAEESGGVFGDFIPSVYRQNLEEMINVLRARGVQVMLYTLPTAVSASMKHEDLEKQNIIFPYFAKAYGVSDFLSLLVAYNRVIRQLGDEHGVPVVDLEAIFNMRDKRRLFWDTMHPSYEGHRVIAGSVVQKIDEVRRNKKQCARYGWERLCTDRLGGRRNFSEAGSRIEGEGGI